MVWVYAITICITLLALWDKHKVKHSCDYCGVYRGHDDHCPYAMLFDD